MEWTAAALDNKRDLKRSWRAKKSIEWMLKKRERVLRGEEGGASLTQTYTN
jgi:hypothetical protein